MIVHGVIPARYQSSRLAGKILADIGGKPMVQHVYERSLLSNCLDEVLVATDEPRVKAAVEAFGGKAIMTSTEHSSGTDRIAEVMAKREADVVVNIQGDEPLIDPLMIREVVEPFRQYPDLQMCTIKKRVYEDVEFADPNVVKVACDLKGFALYFSRSLIPFPRQHCEAFRVYEHVGLYAYSRQCLLDLASLPPSPLEQVESLEQLRALENGIRIMVVETLSGEPLVSVDTQADLDRVRAIVQNQENVS
jgi:3-deoxy-manno-octulosonate cytidylyltransferase (CMP-KDO synthetase)